ncbi:MAG: peptidylprolyl isomerase [Dehalococcoidia bacterium]
MSRERRQEERRLRQRRRREARPGNYVPAAGPVEFPGIMGVFQRNTRLFYLGAMLLMLGSLGAVFFTSNGTSSTRSNTPTPTATAEATSTPEPDPNEIKRVYATAPALQINPASSYEAVIHTDAGDVRVQLDPKDAPGYVNNFVFLAQNRFYNGLSFQRVEPGFVAQAGDPPGRAEGPGYNLTEEKNALPFDSGVISMAKAGKVVNGSQFFITLGAAPHLNSDFTVFGRVTAGMDVLKGFPARPLGAPVSAPAVAIKSIDIIEQPAP